MIFLIKSGLNTVLVVNLSTLYGLLKTWKPTVNVGDLVMWYEDETDIGIILESIPDTDQVVVMWAKGGILTTPSTDPYMTKAFSNDHSSDER
jgi:hypothetical protein